MAVAAVLERRKPMRRRQSAIGSWPVMLHFLEFRRSWVTPHNCVRGYVHRNWPQARDNVQYPARQNEAECAADRREQMFQPSSAGRAGRGSRLSPAAPRTRGRDRRRAPTKIGHVRASHHEKNRSGPEQQWQNVTHAAGKMRSQRQDLCSDVSVGLRVFLRKLCRQRVEFCLGFFDRDSRSKPA